MKQFKFFSPIKSIQGLLIVFLLTSLSVTAQVGIGTNTPAAGSALQIDSTTGALVPPRVTNAQMLAISPLDGAIVYNTEADALFIYSSGSWNNIKTVEPLPSIIISKEWGAGNNNNLVSTSNDTYYKFPIGSSDVLSNNPSFFTVTSNGTVRIEEDGNYLITAGFSVDELPTGDHKYIIGVYKGSTLVGYLVRGNVDMAANDEFGTSGVMVLPFKKNDLVSLQYVLNNGGSPLDARFFKIGIIKM